MSDETSVEKVEPGDLATLANAINTEYRASETALRTGLGHAIKAGELLIEAKGLCPHGTWLPWLRANFEGSERTAQNFMHVARRWPQLAEAKSATVADFSLREALAALAAPSVPVDATIITEPTAPAEPVRASIRDITPTRPEPYIVDERKLEPKPADEEPPEAEAETVRGPLSDHEAARARIIRRAYERERTERLSANPAGRSVAGKQALLNVEAACDRFAQEVVRLLRQVEPEPDPESALALVRIYMETGRTDLDRFLGDVLGNTGAPGDEKED